MLERHKSLFSNIRSMHVKKHQAVANKKKMILKKQKYKRIKMREKSTKTYYAKIVKVENSV